ncbi:hypothetical protein GF373_06590, partial [bacterium]|nr:hypothetical protein [bacterium]
MKILKAILFILILSISLNSYAGPVVKAKQKKDRVSIHIDGKLFTEYKFSKRQKYPYFYPVNGPATGKSITTETSEPYPHHHSLFFGCDHVSGGNYWQDSLERGQIISESIKMIKTKGESIEFRDECVWKRPGAPCPFKDTRIVKIYAPSKDTRFIDFTITLQAEINVTITKTNHSLFSARVMPELSVKNGGTMINSHGKTGEKGTWGNHADWIDYGNTR